LRKIIFIILAAVVFSGCSNEVTPANSNSNDNNSAQSSAMAPKSNDTEKKVPTTASNNPERIKAKVTDVVDGDTIKVLYKGKEETVRMLLIDTPETHHPKLGVQPYGMQASNYTKNLLSGKTIEVEPAVNEGRDKYGRLLAYLFINGQSVQEKILEQGLARVAYIYPPNTKYLDEYRAAEEKAKKKKLRIWSVAGYARDDGYHPEVMAGASKSDKAGDSIGFSPDANGNCGGHIKGNINRDGEKIYHLPNDRFYKVTKAEQCFMTEKDAVKAGFRASRYR